MIVVTVKVRTDYLKELASRFGRGDFSILGRIRRDMCMLGDAGYNYLKTLIPVSQLPHPHLRDSFKVVTSVEPGPGILLSIFTDVSYAPFVDLGAVVPTRYPRVKRALRFVAPSGDVVFTKYARGFRTTGIRFVSKTEAWLARNVGNFVDLTLRRYL